MDDSGKTPPEQNTPTNTTGNSNQVTQTFGVVSSTPQSTTEKKDDYPYHDYSGMNEEEEFTYKPKVGFMAGKSVKILGMIFISLLLIVPVVFLILKMRQESAGTESKKGEIVWQSYGINKEVVQPLIDEYLTKNPKAKITFIEDSPTDYRERLSNSLLQGRGPDIFSFHNSWVPMFRDYLDVMPKEVMTYDDFAKVYYPVIVGNLTTGAGVVGIPLGYDGITLFINEDIFSTAGKVVPRTWDQFRQTANELTTKNEKGLILQSGAALGITSNVDYWPEIIALLLFQDKVNLYKMEGTEAEDALSFYVDFYTFDKVWDATLPSSVEAFANGKVAMIFAPASAANDINKINNNINFRTVPLPQVRRDDPEEPDVSYSTYWAQGVWSKSPNKELAWDFLKFLSTKESLENIYNNSKGLGLVGVPYPRIDMRDELIGGPVLGSVLALAPNSKYWFLASDTNDGESGLNSLLDAAFKTGIDSLSATKNRKSVSETVKTINGGSAVVYAKFGIGSQ